MKYLTGINSHGIHWCISMERQGRQIFAQVSPEGALTREQMMYEVGQYYRQFGFDHLINEPTPVTEDYIQRTVDQAVQKVREEIKAITEAYDANMIKQIESARTFEGQMGQVLSDLKSPKPPVRSPDADKLTQFLGVSLRDVLPFAIESVAQRRYQAEVNEDPDAMVSAAKAHQFIDRAEAALVALGESPLNIDEIQSNDLDEEFTITFEE